MTSTIFGQSIEKLTDMGRGNEIHQTAIISHLAIIGAGNYFGPHCVVHPGTIIGDGNRFESHVSIGSPPEHKSFWGKAHRGLIIGNDNVFREFVTLNAGTESDSRVSDGVAMLRGSHLGHDAVIHRGATISCNALIGGHAVIEAGANCGLASMIHQYCRIGAYSMLGMGTVVTKKTCILPANVYIGSPARFLKENSVGIERAGLSIEDVSKMRILFKEKWLTGEW